MMSLKVPQKEATSCVSESPALRPSGTYVSNPLVFLWFVEALGRSNFGFCDVTQGRIPTVCMLSFLS